MIHITIEGKKSLEQIQRKFANALSEKEILKATAFTLNETARKTMSAVKTEVKKSYTVNNKYLGRMAKLKKPASGTTSGLYAEISYSYKPIPMIGFEHKPAKRTKFKKSNTGIEVYIIKGKKEILKHVFIATMRSRHTGIFGRGSYVGGKYQPANERTASGKQRISELKTSSPLTMGTNKDIQKRIASNIERTMPERLRAILQQRVDKLTR